MRIPSCNSVSTSPRTSVRRCSGFVRLNRRVSLVSWFFVHFICLAKCFTTFNDFYSLWEVVTCLSRQFSIAKVTLSVLKKKKGFVGCNFGPDLLFYIGRGQAFREPWPDSCDCLRLHGWTRNTCFPFWNVEGFDQKRTVFPCNDNCTKMANNFSQVKLSLLLIGYKTSLIFGCSGAYKNMNLQCICNNTHL